MSEGTRRKKGKHVRIAEPEADPEFQIAPMIDILLVLLVFFMSISSTEVLQSNQDVDLPVAKEAKDKPKSNPGQVIINVLYNKINNATVVEIDQQQLPPTEILRKLQSQVALNPQIRVLIRADREVRYEFMRTLLENIGKAGVGTVTFSVVDKEDPSRKSS